MVVYMILCLEDSSVLIIMYKHQVIPKVIIAMIKINRRKYSWNNLGMGAEYAMDNNTRNSLE